jgi:hypothetical protein
VTPEHLSGEKLRTQTSGFVPAGTGWTVHWWPPSSVESRAAAPSTNAPAAQLSASMQLSGEEKTVPARSGSTLQVAPASDET